MFWRQKNREASVTTANEIRVDGYIGHHGLSEWWLTTFTLEERQFIEDRYRPMGSSGQVTLTRGKPSTTHDSTGRGWTAFKFLYNLAGWFKNKDHAPIALKMLDKALEMLPSAKPLDKHFFYSTYIEVRYKQRNDDPQAINNVIQACEDMIAIAPMVVKAFHKEYGDLGETIVPPRHKGYEQLIVIREKRGDKQEAERLQKEFEEVWRE